MKFNLTYSFVIFFLKSILGRFYISLIFLLNISICFYIKFTNKICIKIFKFAENTRIIIFHATNTQALIMHEA